MPKQILVLGLHRSGTSALAGLLHHLGVFMGDNLRGASSSNPKGHFEDHKLQGVLDSLVGYWQTPRRVETIDERQVAKIQEYVDTYTAQHELWGCKDPRLCYGGSIIARFCSNPIIISTERELEESAQSLIARNNMPHSVAYHILNDYYITWQKTVRDCAVSGIPVFIMNYKDICEHTEEVIDDLLSVIQTEITEEQRQNAIAFIDPNLRHQRV